MQSVYIAVRVRPFPRLPPLEQSGCGPSTLDIARVEPERIAAFDAVPLEGLQEELRHGCIAVVRIEYINVLGPKPGALVRPPGGAVGPVLDLVQIGLRGALPEAVL